MNPRRLYKQVFCPVFPDGSVAFFGFGAARAGSIPPTVEMQSRFFAMVTTGSVALPCTDEMERVAKIDQANWEWRFGYDAKRVKGLVDFQIYCDELAAELGSLPPLMSLFLSKPSIWWKIMFGPFTMHQYRLTGPYANPEVASLYAKSPAGDFLECSITAAFLITAKILSILGFASSRLQQLLSSRVAQLPPPPALPLPPLRPRPPRPARRVRNSSTPGLAHIDHAASAADLGKAARVRERTHAAPFSRFRCTEQPGSLQTASLAYVKAADLGGGGGEIAPEKDRGGEGGLGGGAEGFEGDLVLSFA